MSLPPKPPMLPMLSMPPKPPPLIPAQSSIKFEQSFLLRPTRVWQWSLTEKTQKVAKTLPPPSLFIPPQPGTSIPVAEDLQSGHAKALTISKYAKALLEPDFQTLYKGAFRHTVSRILTPSSVKVLHFRGQDLFLSYLFNLYWDCGRVKGWDVKMSAQTWWLNGLQINCVCKVRQQINYYRTKLLTNAALRCQCVDQLMETHLIFRG